CKPIGVIGALSPSTNPEATPVIKGINAVKGRNAIVIAPHPRAKFINMTIVNKMRDALVKMGAPADLVQTMAQPSIEKTEALMKQCDFILATGGPGMVTAAYSSGTPALGVGAGNAVITVDDTADLVDAAEKIRISKTLDLAASCSADNSVIVLETVYDSLLNHLIAEGGHVVSKDEADQIAAVLWDNGALNTAAVVKQPQVLAQMSGFAIPDDRKFIIVPYDGVGPEHPFSGEKLSAVMALYKVADIHEAVALTNAIQEYQGMGHSCGIYSNSDDNILTLANGTKTSRVMVNQPQAASNSGNLWNGMRQTFSLGCGSWGGNSTNENINWRHLVNVTWVSKPLKQAKVLPSDDELFGQVIAKLG
ncbi:MAG: aldehyde dehydrogenase family protein, partial [Luminiphilus sp.]|nr:aldehyde dehydrogenase family protein [Luminiphilus sp.]